ncbi:hypothetical protein K435DRAFT_811079 [Dendrothele bispora CBS 962.96]|uniref:CCHC-type domain-containing protein n=1 Tax=Dendrothele bispora (strain CBS 962.96) TaxID=1314807 RepID=A0A4V4HBD3_DENBC|nr:hypothetical protein K435DRAFT_811079 [Dendrothele bispora CBS 962.96]
MDIEPFVGDGSNPRENPHNFLRKWQLSLTKLKKDAEDKEKVSSFQLYCSVGSAADEWFDELTLEQKSSMASFIAAFEKRWPKVKAAKKTRAEYEVELLGHKLAEEDVGKKVELYGQEVFTHMAWAEKIRELVQGAGVDITTSSIYLGQVRQNIPDALQDELKGEYANWEGYLTAVKGLSADTVTRISRRLQEARTEKQSIANQLAELQRMRIPQLPASPTAPLRRAMANTSISDIRPPRFPSGQGGGAQNILYQRVPGQTANTFSSLPALSEKELTDLRTRIDSIPQQPDTPAGQTAYKAQITAWEQQHGTNTRVDHTKPYPLTPGTAPTCSGECFKCGAHGHIGPLCAINRHKAFVRHSGIKVTGMLIVADEG